MQYANYKANMNAVLRYDTSISPSAKLLFMDILYFTGEGDYCFVSDNQLAIHFDTELAHIKDLLYILQDRKYIDIDYIDGKRVIIPMK